MKRLMLAALAALGAAAAAPALAGRSCEPKPLDVAALDRGLALAERSARALDASGARVAVIARAGQDLSRWGLRWSHLGLAYREPTSGRWRVVHKLNHCGRSDAALYRQGLGEFFLDDLWRAEAAVLPLAPEVQAKLLPLLADDARVTALNQRAYSMVAYPWSQTYQQSNQWAIETIALAAEPGASTRERAQAWLQCKDYRPTPLRVDAMTRLGARLSQANVAFDDHPNAKRYAGRIETVTVDSVFDWLERSGLGSRVAHVR
jgi:hypothetical protein